MLDVGVMAQFAWYQDENGKERKLNGNLEYIALQFPIMKRLGLGMGLEPFSYVGYNYGTTEKLELIDGYAQKQYIGNGGMSKVYGALSYNLFNRLSVGVKVAYLFGDVTHNIIMYNSDQYSFNNSWIDTLRISGLTYDFGLQYSHPAGKNKTLTIGLVYSPKLPIHGSVRKDTLSLSSGGSGIIIGNYVSSDSVFELPQSYGFGFTFTKLFNYTFGADVLYQRWADAKFYDQTNALNNRLRFSAGGEYIPNLMTNKYHNRIRYRAGLNYTNSYVKVEKSGYEKSGYKEYGASIGVGLPMVDRRSFINLAFEYSLIQPEIKTSLKEQYFRFTLSYTFNETWFFKQRLQ